MAAARKASLSEPDCGPSAGEASMTELEYGHGRSDSEASEAVPRLDMQS